MEKSFTLSVFISVMMLCIHSSGFATPEATRCYSSSNDDIFEYTFSGETNQHVFFGINTLNQTPARFINDYIERDNIKKTITVSADGTGNYTTISRAFESITNSSYDNQYEVLVMPGTYKESDLQLPAYTHLKGIGGQNAVVIYDDVVDAPWIIDQAFPSKMSNLTLDILNGEAYVIHFDAPTLSYGVTVNKNLKIIHRGGGRGNSVIGGGSWAGYISVWENCEFIGFSGLPACHTKQNSANSIDLRFINCSFSSGVNLGSVGGYELSRVTFSNCAFKGAIQGWISLIRNQPELWKYPANNFEWKISGGGNKGLVFDFSKIANSGEALKIESTNFSEDLTISGTAINVLFGSNYKPILSNPRIKGKIIGWSDVRDIQSGLKPYSVPIDVIQMWKRLGDCSQIPKTLTVTVKGIPQTYTFDKNYLVLKPSEATLIAGINSVIRNAVVSKVPGINMYDFLDISEKATSIVGDADGILKNELVYFADYTVKKAGRGSESKNVKGIAVSEGKKGELIVVWGGTFYIDLKDGEYGVGTKNQLSMSESVKVGYVKSNIFYPYY